jgi:hypothetical protein
MPAWGGHFWGKAVCNHSCIKPAELVPETDVRSVSARLGFPGVWSSLENSAYPNW